MGFGAPSGRRGTLARTAFLFLRLGWVTSNMDVHGCYRLPHHRPICKTPYDGSSFSDSRPRAGCGFRWYVQREASELDLRGWVRNTEEGDVEVVASGEAADLAELRASLRRGPRGSRVDRLVEHTWTRAKPKAQLRSASMARGKTSISYQLSSANSATRHSAIASRYN